MEITGKIIAKPETVTGVSSRGEWRKASIVVRYDDGQYPKDIILTSMRKAAELEAAQVGQTGTFRFDATARQASNGKWYGENDCWGLTIDSAAPSNDMPI